ncbi:hypothetical protein CGLO_12546 [Colletotrichum gloeosporioides Cg-14]|uniref:Uncharacterized protein n=1 Tax=Colletotrichum gloeosporioides (strain Cg-14) TaxID=1237896 RepID=T0L9A9_COLGC|nr:hypothetical protein CGLO_12546 [Colletotrichum gloeosporioides Cg-14]
MLADLAHN